MQNKKYRGRRRFYLGYLGFMFIFLSGCPSMGLEREPRREWYCQKGEMTLKLTEPNERYSGSAIFTNKNKSIIIFKENIWRDDDLYKKINNTTLYVATEHKDIGGVYKLVSNKPSTKTGKSPYLPIDLSNKSSNKHININIEVEVITHKKKEINYDYADEI